MAIKGKASLTIFFLLLSIVFVPMEVAAAAAARKLAETANTGSESSTLWPIFSGCFLVTKWGLWFSTGEPSFVQNLIINL
uniref:Uncharacterized protein n=1 Tax=Nelumbo nucifera TaxID=4432 RepID=A0A822Z148_NELNU|nr:TPA_asm: hypothetical protein HUJ06_005848 [Nelumbo nucifera]